MRYYIIFLGILFIQSFQLLAFAGEDPESKLPIYRNLVMEGGGIKGIAYGGALAELEERGVLRHITRVAGTSAGAIQASLFAIGYNAEEITEIINTTPIESFNDDGFIVKGSKRLLKKYGWFKGDAFLQKITELIALRTGNPNLTFAQLHQLAKSHPFRDLYVTGANLSQQRVEIFSHETYPNMRVADAVRISMSIPLFYEAIWLDKDGKVQEEGTECTDCSLFVDGGLLMNYPVEIFDNPRYVENVRYTRSNSGYFFNEETLGLRLERCDQIDYDIQNKRAIAPISITDFSSYTNALSTVLMRNVAPPHPRDPERTIYINDLGMSSKVRKVPQEEKEMLMLSGRQGVYEFLGRLEERLALGNDKE